MMQEELFLGIDPSTKATGYSVLTATNELIVCGALMPDKKEMTPAEQALFQYEKLDKIMKEHRITRIGCEDQFSGVNKDTFKKLSRVTGYMILLAGQHDVPIRLYQPSAWRKITHGTGKATKKVTRLWANETYDLKLRVKDEDISDSLGICYAMRKETLEEIENGDTGREVS